ncbi:hypothetical protein LWI29_004086 [Acer saccharum]|uniref:RNase H type-1 domain-containing protein n=1 Tax=Acer saccharum TaxID=4024 RepID=A0AA39VUY5_ACESA|nr:hypothetical protein LWI29_004086 [Acer saccharum]
MMMSIFSSFDALCAEFYGQKFDFSDAAKPKQEASLIKRSSGFEGNNKTEEQQQRRRRIQESTRRPRFAPELDGVDIPQSKKYNYGFKNVVAETDSSSVVQLLNTESSPNHPLFSLIQSCKEIINGDWRCVMQHIYREGNFLTDGLAHMGHKMEMGLRFLNRPSAALREIFDTDGRGTSRVRQCSTSIM